MTDACRVDHVARVACLRRDPVILTASLIAGGLMSLGYAPEGDEQAGDAGPGPSTDCEATALRIEGGYNGLSGCPVSEDVGGCPG